MTCAINRSPTSTKLQCNDQPIGAANFKSVISVVTVVGLVPTALRSESGNREIAIELGGLPQVLVYVARRCAAAVAPYSFAIVVAQRNCIGHEIPVEGF